MGSIFKFITDGGVEIQFFNTEDNYLRVICSVVAEKHKEMPYKIIKAPFGEIEYIDDKVKVGNFFVKQEAEGYILYDSNQNPIYRSVVEIVMDISGKFVAIETPYDRVGSVQELWETRTYFDKYKFMGMGEAAYTLLLNNNSYTLCHYADLGNQAYVYIPFYFTNEGHGFYYNANTNDVFDFKDTDEGETVTYKTKELYFDYYAYKEDTPKETVSRFYDFSASRSLMPKWTYGYFQSKFGYKTEEEVYELIEKIDEYKLPVSAIVIDLHWYKRMGDLDWNREAFPHYEQMHEDLKKRGIKLITISQPYFTCNSKNFKEFEENGLFVIRNKEVTEIQTLVWGDWWCGNDLYGSIINPIAPKAQEILGKKYVELMQKGIDGFWLDLGEPENVPLQAFYGEYQNETFSLYFGREWIKIVHKAVSEAYPNYRPFILARCGFTGAPGYQTAIWSGDCSSNFINFRRQILLAINSGITGFSNWGSDSGGFLSQFKLPDEELYIRWNQFSCFSPMFRTHGKKTPREPWAFSEKTSKIAMDLIWLRKKLLPYIYSAAYETYRKGIPMMRGLYLEHPEDEHSYTINDEYYFGDNMLVAPVLESAKVSPVKEVYLPEGLWYDFKTLKPFKSGTYSVELELDYMPVYLKAGSVIPLENEIIVTQSENAVNDVCVWYDDDGETNDYLKGDYEEISLQLADNKLLVNNVKNEKSVQVKYAKLDGTTITKDVVLNPGNNTIELD